MKTYRFKTDLRCYLANGTTDVLRDYEVAVEAYTTEAARGYLGGIATEMITQAGSRLLDAPLERLEIIRAEAIGPTPAEIERAFADRDMAAVAAFVDGGYASARYSAGRLNMTIDDLADIMASHGYRLDL